MDIDGILQALVAYLASCLDASGSPNAGIIPGVKTVLSGDVNPLDKEQPAITVVWAGEDLSRASFGLGSVPLQADFDINLYLGSLPKGDVPDRRVRELYSSTAGTRGLRAALLAYPGGQGFILGFGAARPLRKSEKPDVNFSSGLTVRATARALGFK